jgi:hypothetical protein
MGECIFMGRGPKWHPLETDLLLECLNKGMGDREISTEFKVKNQFVNSNIYRKRSLDAVGSKRRSLKKKGTSIPNSNSDIPSFWKKLYHFLFGSFRVK